MFTLDFNIPESKNKINLKDKVCLMGSCFSDEIGRHLENNKFNSLVNPFGTIYNPHSIFKLITNQVKVENVVESQGIYYHWDAHGAVSGLSAAETQSLFNQKQRELLGFLTHTKWLVITLGTSLVYEHNEAGIVANCHKIPNDQFRKKFLTQTDITDQFKSVHSYLNSLNPELNILFTISPVRHIRDGLVENNRSKALLIDSVHTLVDEYTNVHYFPSYEILIDELRDYRFYAEDMIHPSSQASTYMWEKFKATYFDQQTIDVLKEWRKIQTALSHKAFQPNSKSHQEFLKNTVDRLTKMNDIIDLSIELEQLKTKIQ